MKIKTIRLSGIESISQPITHNRIIFCCLSGEELMAENYVEGVVLDQRGWGTKEYIDDYPHEDLKAIYEANWVLEDLHTQFDRINWKKNYCLKSREEQKILLVRYRRSKYISDSNTISVCYDALTDFIRRKGDYVIYVTENFYKQRHQLATYETDHGKSILTAEDDTVYPIDQTYTVKLVNED